MPMHDRETVTFRDVSLIFKNFTGEEGKFNREGDRNFSIILDEALAADLERKGLNVKPMRRQEEDDEQLYHLKVKVSYKFKAPRVWLLSNVDPETGRGRNKTMLAESMVGLLDQLDSTNVDLVIAPYNWEVSGKTGKTAYLQSLFFTMYEDELEREYGDVAEVSAVGDSAPQLELPAGDPHSTLEGEWS